MVYLASTMLSKEKEGAECVLGEQGGLKQGGRGKWTVQSCGRNVAGLWGGWGQGRAPGPTRSSCLGCAVDAGEGLWEQVGELGVSLLCDLGAHSPSKTAMM